MVIRLMIGNVHLNLRLPSNNFKFTPWSACPKTTVDCIWRLRFDTVFSLPSSSSSFVVNIILFLFYGLFVWNKMDWNIKFGCNINVGDLYLTKYWPPLFIITSFKLNKRNWNEEVIFF